MVVGWFAGLLSLDLVVVCLYFGFGFLVSGEFAFDLFGGWVWRLLGVLLLCMVCTAFTDLFAGCGFCGLRILWVLGFVGGIST